MIFQKTKLITADQIPFGRASMLFKLARLCFLWGKVALLVVPNLSAIARNDFPSFFQFCSTTSSISSPTALWTSAKKLRRGATVSSSVIREVVGADIVELFCCFLREMIFLPDFSSVGFLWATLRQLAEESLKLTSLLRFLELSCFLVLWSNSAASSVDKSEQSASVAAKSKLVNWFGVFGGQR